MIGANPRSEIGGTWLRAATRKIFVENNAECDSSREEVVQDLFQIRRHLGIQNDTETEPQKEVKIEAEKRAEQKRSQMIATRLEILRRLGSLLRGLGLVLEGSVGGSWDLLEPLSGAIGGSWKVLGLLGRSWVVSE